MHPSQSLEYYKVRASNFTQMGTWSCSQRRGTCVVLLKYDRNKLAAEYVIVSITHLHYRLRPVPMYSEPMLLHGRVQQCCFVFLR